MTKMGGKDETTDQKRTAEFCLFTFCVLPERSLYEITVRFFPQVKMLESCSETGLWLALDADRLCF